MPTSIMLDTLGPFSHEATGVFFRGNLHLHTTRSDGKLSPDAVMAAYRDNGYDFVAITDHNKLPDGVKPIDGITMIPGAEVDYPSYAGPLKHFHFVALGLEKVPDRRREFARPADLYRHLEEHSEYVFLAHPHWSNLVTSDLLELEPMCALEVFNTGCQSEVSRGYSSYPWDGVLGTGRTCMGLAVDDSHRMVDDCYGGWVWVRAEENTPEALMLALQNGHFYSSMGPRVADLSVTDNVVTIRSATPCREIRALANLPASGRNVGGRPDMKDEVTQLAYELKGTEHYLRFELVDADGNLAWTNPIYFEVS